MNRNFRCPNCGNRNPAKFEDNGRRLTDPDLALICVARVEMGDDAHGGGEVGKDGKVACGQQWEPNS